MMLADRLNFRQASDRIPDVVNDVEQSGSGSRIGI
jgi:hypothetical protein